jgi:hypothetical protein
MYPCQVLIAQATQVELHDIKPAVSQAVLQAEYVPAVPQIADGEGEDTIRTIMNSFMTAPLP